jgi:putative ABC transport system permease protein
MIRLALTGLAARKLRTALTAVAIVLGVGMVTGSFVLTDTISKAFTSIFTSAYRDTDAVVTGRKLVDWSASGNATVSADVLARVRALPAVGEASGTIANIAGDSTKATIIDREGEPIIGSGNPTFGIGVDPHYPRFNPLRLVTGTWAHGPREVVIDTETASNEGFRLGDMVRVVANGPARPFRLVGTARFGDVSSLGGATFAVWDVPTAATMLGSRGFTSISVAAAPGVGSAELVRSLRAVVPPGTVVRTGQEQAAKDQGTITSFISFIRGFLLGFGAVALLVGGFVIFNSLSITLAQRTRELGTIRALGASAPQVRRLVLVEALVLGSIASLAGMGLGIALARGLSAVAGALGLELPQAATVYAPRTFVVSLAVGLAVTTLAALVPARRAIRVPPIAAIRAGTVAPGTRRLGATVGAGLVATAAILLVYAVHGGHLGDGSHLLALAAGAALALVGLAAVTPPLVRSLVRVTGAPSRRLGGIAGSLASENASRSPARTAATASALMIGLALVTFVSVLGAGVKASYRDGLREQFAADWVVTSQDGWSAFPRAAGDALRDVPGARDVSSIRTDRGLVGTSQATVNGVDAATLDGMYRFAWTGGSSEAALASLGASGAILKRSFARDNGLHVGDGFVLRASSGERLRLVVRGLYQPARLAELTGGVVIAQPAFDAFVARPQNAFTLVRGDVSRQRLERALAAFPGVKVQTRDEFVVSQAAFIDQLTSILLVLLGLSVVVSLFGMVNTLVLAVFERTRELGMLRAVGMSRRQVRRMVRHESVITALVGAALGLPLGIALAAVLTHGLEPYGVRFELPAVPIAAFTLLAIVCGIVAAMAPARRASRLDVLAALQYE